jgi:FkbM family methyltransferase
MKRLFIFILARWASILGFTVVPKGSRRLQKSALDHVVENLKSLAVSKPVIFDVGANTGQSIGGFLARMPGARIHAFEPGPTAYGLLGSAWGKDSRVVLNQLALGASPGEVTLHENRELTMSSLYELGQAGWGQVSGSHPVKMSTVDCYCETKGLHRLDLLKCDTQGHDLEVLKGAEVMLEKQAVGLLCLELIFSEIYRGMPAYHELLKWLAERNYHLTAITDIHYQDGVIGWADALFAPKTPTLI